MRKLLAFFRNTGVRAINRFNSKTRTKLIAIFLVAKVIPLVLLSAIAWQQIVSLGSMLQKIAVDDSSAALNASAVENIERMTTDTAQRVASFLYDRDDDIRYLATLPQLQEIYRAAQSGTDVDSAREGVEAAYQAFGSSMAIHK